MNRISISNCRYRLREIKSNILIKISRRILLGRNIQKVEYEKNKKSIKIMMVRKYKLLKAVISNPDSWETMTCQKFNQSTSTHSEQSKSKNINLKK